MLSDDTEVAGAVLKSSKSSSSTKLPVTLPRVVDPCRAYVDTSCTYVAELAERCELTSAELTAMTDESPTSCGSADTGTHDGLCWHSSDTDEGVDRDGTDWWSN